MKTINTEDKWKLTKTISLPSLLSTLALIGVTIMYVTDIEADVAVLKSQQTTTEKNFDQIDTKLEKILDKLLTMN
tara:strand:+ start:1087 stop:1311 length:225 start_codon:yes stop_codon:yes gene_type:complete